MDDSPARVLIYGTELTRVAEELHASETRPLLLNLTGPKANPQVQSKDVSGLAFASPVPALFWPKRCTYVISRHLRPTC